VESDIVLAHKLEQFHVLFVLPPLLPLVSIACSNRDVADRSIEPNVEHFLFELFKRYRGSPLKVPSDASAEKTVLEHRVGEADCVGRPTL
jgi:hypothetical protein